MRFGADSNEENIHCHFGGFIDDCRGGAGTPKPFHIMTTTQANLALLVIVLAMGTPLLSMAIINMGLLVKITM